MFPDYALASRVFSVPRDGRSGVDETDRLPLAVLVCAGTASLLASMGMAGSLFDEPALGRIAPGFATMKGNTALCLLLLALGFVVRRAVSVGLAVAVGLIAIAELAEYLSDSSFGIDQLVFTDHSGDLHPGRSSAATATCLLLIGAARLLDHRRFRAASQALAVLALTIGLLALVGYAYGVRSLYDVGVFATVALHTALALVLLAVAVLANTPGGALTWAVRAEDAGASLVRRLLPLALIGLPGVGYVCVLAQRVGLVRGHSTLALLVVLCVLALGTVTWAAAVRVSQIDRSRVQVLAEMTELKNGLEDQVLDRAAQVQLRREEIAVLEDRHRIAADLHDIVIQRLFAAGMFLQGADVGANPDNSRRVEAALEAMDGAVGDLRASIFELGGRAPISVDLGSALDGVCEESARVLGFTPELTVDDPDLEAETVREDLLAVVREALANVARHAESTRTRVVVRSGNGLISLTVTDNGKGMTEHPHSSGTRNMADRARRLGGDCVWTSARPSGTRVWWHVPGVRSVLDGHGVLADSQPVPSADL